MKKKLAASYSVPAIAWVLFALIISSRAFAENTSEQEQPNTLASWSLPDAKGKMVDFKPKDARGYTVVLFWATWCPYCKALMPRLEEFRAAHEGENNEFLALNIWEDGDATDFVEKTKFNFRLILNADEIAKNYGIKGTPGLYLVNNANEILYERRSGTSPEQVITDLEFILTNQLVHSM